METHDLESTIVGLEKLGKKLDCQDIISKDIKDAARDLAKGAAYLAISPFVIASFVEDFDDEEPGALIPSLALIVPFTALFEYGLYGTYLHNHINNPYILPVIIALSNGISLGKEISKHKGLSNYVHDKFERVTNW